MVQARDLLTEVLSLPEDERADIALRLLESLGPHGERTDAEWVAELERRAKRVLAGKSSGAPWEDVRQRIESALKK